MATVTIGSDTFNVYGSVSEGDTYFNGRLASSNWSSATADDKARALVMAARWLDRQIWIGSKTSDSQALEFPRTGLTCNGVTYASDAVPDRIESAAYELALLVLSDATSFTTGSQGTNVKFAKGGPAEVEFFRPTYGTGEDTVFPDFIMDLVGCFLGGGSLIVTVVYGTNNKSHSLDDDYDLTRGF